MSAAPIASGARAALPRTAQPTVKTSPNVPMNSVTYLRMCDPLLEGAAMADSGARWRDSHACPGRLASGGCRGGQQRGWCRRSARSSLGRPRSGSLAPEEGQQVGVELVLKCGGEAVRRTRVVDLLRAVDEPGGFPGRVLDGNDLVVLAVQDQSRDIELMEVLGEIGLGEGLDAVVGVVQPGLHAPQPELVQHALGDLGTRPVSTIELHGKLFVELRPVPGQAGAQAVEDLNRQPLRIGA